MTAFCFGLGQPATYPNVFFSTEKSRGCMVGSFQTSEPPAQGRWGARRKRAEWHQAKLQCAADSKQTPQRGLDKSAQGKVNASSASVHRRPGE